MGRVGVDLYPEQSGVRLADVTTFRKSLGGSATNVAVAAGRLGRRSGVITRTGADPFGEFVTRQLEVYGVDASQVRSVPGLLTPITFCEIFPPDDFPLYFYREPVAPDLMIAADELDLDVVRDAELLWITTTGLSREPSRAAHLTALEARAESGGTTVLDLDFRSVFWPDRSDATARIAEVLPLVDVAVGNLEECAVAVGSGTPDELASRLHERGVDLVVVKQGPNGVLGSQGRGVVRVVPEPVTVRNGLGAGDAFGGALCHGLLAGWDLRRTLELANRAGAHVAARLGCADAMPTLDELHAEERPNSRLESNDPNGTEKK